MAMDDLSLALSLATVADELTLSGFRQEAVTASEKPDGSLVTAVDLAVESALKAELRAARPGDAVLGEETAGTVTSGRTWVIDPLDHTVNFVRRLPEFATLIALLVDAKPYLGVVSAPALGRRWWAERGHGAFADGGAPLRVSGVADVAEAYLSFAALPRWQAQGRLSGLLDLAARAKFTTGSGGFWAQMMVAEGRLDVCLDPWGELWDLAPIQVVVEEAGGRLTDVAGAARPDHGCAIVTNGILHEETLAALNRDTDLGGPCH